MSTGGAAPELLRVTYHLDVAATDADARAEEIAREQTVEVPREAVRDPIVAREAMGRVECVEADPDGGFRATLAYPVGATGLAGTEKACGGLGNRRAAAYRAVSGRHRDHDEAPLEDERERRDRESDRSARQASTESAPGSMPLIWVLHEAREISAADRGFN